MSTIKWALDPTHSELGFKIRHLMISNVNGSFKSFQVTAETEGENFSGAKVEVTAEIKSIFTNNDQRDAHLHSGDFFEADKFPELKFVAKKVEANGSDMTLAGDLTIKGITKEVTLNAEFNGIAKDPWGNQKAGFTVDGKINRKDWELNWNAPLEAGGFLLGDDIKIHGEIQLVKQA
ncbi:MAG: YceI family protein [Flavobacteriales bacterium]|nr:YceI family protein [Flavobacteriales bacterium]